MEIQQSKDFPFFGIATGCDGWLVFGQVTPVQNVTVLRADPISREQFGHFIGHGVRVGILRDRDLDG